LLVFPTKNSMFDWPEASHTSPSNTFSTFISLLPLKLIVKGPPALSVVTYVSHLPLTSAVMFVVLLFQLVVINTFSLGLAQPHNATLLFCCSTILLLMTEGSLTAE